MEQVSDEELYEAIQLVVCDYRIGGVSDPMGQLIHWLWDQINGALSVVRDALEWALYQARDAILRTLSEIREALAGVINSALTALEDLVNGAIKGITDFINDLISGISGTLATLTDTIGGFFEQVFSALSDLGSTITGVVETILDGITSGISGLMEAFQNIGNTIMSAISGVVSTITGVVSTIVDTVSGAISGLMSSMMDALTSIRDFLSSAFADVVNSISGMVKAIADQIGGLATSITNALGSLRDAFANMISTISNTLASISAGIADAFAGLRDFLSKAFSDVIEGITKAISGFVDTVIDALKGFGERVQAGFSTIVDTISGAFSQVESFFASAFKNISAGLVEVMHTLMGFVNAVGNLGSMMASWFEGIPKFFGWVYENVSDFIKATVEFFTKTVPEFFTKTIPKFFTEDIPKALSSAWDTFVEVTKPIWTPFYAFFDWIYQNLPDFINSAVEFFTKTVPKFFTEDLPKAVSSAWDTLVKVTEPVWKPVQDFFGWVYENVKGFIDSAVEFFTKTVPDFFTKTVPEFFTKTIPKFFMEDVPKALSSAWDFLVKVTEPVWKPIHDFFGWIYDNVKGFIDSAVEFFTKTVPDFFTKTLPKFFLEDLPKTVGGWFEGAKKWLWDNVAKPVVDGWNWFVKNLQDAWDGFVKFVTDLTETAPPLLKFLLKWFMNPLGAIFEAVGGAGKWLQENVFAPAYDWLKNNVIGPAWDTLKGIWDAITTQFSDLIKDPVKTLSEKFGHVAEGLYGAIQATGDALSKFIQWVVKFFIGLKDAFVGAVKPLVDESTKGIAEQVREWASPHTLPKEADHIKVLVSEVVHTPIKKILETAKRHGQVEENLVFGMMETAMQALIFTALALAIGVGIDNLKPQGQPLGIWKQIRTIFNQAGGYFITSFPSSSALFFVIHPIMRRYLQKMTRPVLPGPQQLTMMKYREKLAEDAWKVYMSELGYEDVFIDGFDFINRPLPTDEELARAVYRQVIDEESYSKYMGWWGWLDEFKQMLLEVHRPLLNIPTITTNYFRERMDEKTLSDKVLAYGFRSDDIDYIVEAARPLPTVTQAMTMWFRNQIKLEDLRKLIAWRGYHTKDPFNIVDAFIESGKRIPPYSDLVTMVVREVILPSQFKQILRNLGFFEAGYWSPDGKFQQFEGVKIETYANIRPGEDVTEQRGKIEWADAIYEMHWRLPSLSQVFEFYNRAAAGFIPEFKPTGSLEEAVKQVEKYIATYATLWDYKPAKRRHYGVEMPVSDTTLVRLLRFRLPSRIQLRFMRRWGQISKDEMKRFYVALGFDPRLTVKTAEGKEVKLIDALAEAEFLQLIMEERTLARTALIRSFEKGFKPWDQVEKNLKELKFQTEEIEVLKLAAKTRRLNELNEDKVKSIIQDYVDGTISDEEFNNKISEIIVDEDIKKLVVEEATRKKVTNALRRVRKYAEAELETIFKRYEEGFASRNELVKRVKELLKDVPVTDQELEILFKGADERRLRNLQRLTLHALGAKARRGEITASEFIKEAIAANIEKEFAELYAEQYAKHYELTIPTILSYADEVPIPSGLLERKMEALGVPQDERQLVKAVVKFRPISDERRATATRITDSYVDGIIKEEEFKKQLQQLGYTKEEIDLRLSSAKIKRVLNYRKLRAKTLDIMLREQLEAMAKNQPAELITIEEYKNGMKELGFTDAEIIEKIQQFMADKLKQRLPEWQPVLGAKLGMVM